jgi:ribosomal protein S21
MSKHYQKGNDEDRFAKSGTTVSVRGGNIEKAIRRFKKKCVEENIVMEYRERQHYVGGSEKRRTAKEAGRQRWLRTLREMSRW